jgi:hypothetical protein
LRRAARGMCYDFSLPLFEIQNLQINCSTFWPFVTKSLIEMAEIGHAVTLQPNKSSEMRESFQYKRSFLVGSSKKMGSKSNEDLKEMG